MVKITILLTRRSGFTHEQFVEYWTQKHTPLLAELPGDEMTVQRYVQLQPTSDSIPGIQTAPVDGVAELWVDTVSDAAARFTSDTYKTVVAEDARREMFAGRPRCPAADRPAPAGTRVGHNHRRVADLDAAAAFYESIGFAPNPSFMRMRDFNAHGSFLHRLAINDWQGEGAPAAPPDAAGLHHLQLTYTDDHALQQALNAVDGKGTAVS